LIRQTADPHRPRDPKQGKPENLAYRPVEKGFAAKFCARRLARCLRQLPVNRPKPWICRAPQGFSTGCYPLTPGEQTKYLADWIRIVKETPNRRGKGALGRHPEAISAGGMGIRIRL